MINEIILTPYQKSVFLAAEQLLKTQGYLNNPLFEDTYVLSKKLTHYVKNSVPWTKSGGADFSDVRANEAYMAVLDIFPTSGQTNTSTNSGAFTGIPFTVASINPDIITNTNLGSGGSDPGEQFGQSTQGASDGGSEGGSITPVSNN